MDQQLEQYLKEMEKEDFQEILQKLEIDVKNTDTDAMAKADRYALYKAELEAKFAETDIQITTLNELKTLEDATNLADFKSEMARQKAEVTNPASTEMVDNTSDFTNMETKIEELKVLIWELQTVIDEYKSNKKSMNETEKTEKEKEIKEKKDAIEAKRKEIQEIIDKIKKWRKEFKFDEIDDPTIKEALKKQKEEEEKRLVGFQKELDNLQTPASTAGERVRNVADKARKRAKRNPWAAWWVLVWGWLLLARMFWAFKRKKKKNAEWENEESDNGGKKKEKSRFGRNRWKLLLGWVGARALRKILFGKKDTDENAWEWTWINGILRNVENGVTSFEAIENQTTKENLNQVWTWVNEFYTGIYTFNDGTVPQGIDTAKLWEANFDKHPGVIPHIIDNSFTNIDSFVSQKGLMRLSVHATIDDIVKAMGDMIAGGMETLVGFVLGTVWFTWKNVKMDAVREFISWSNKREEVIKIRQMIYKTFSYANYVENAYIRKNVYEKVRAWNAIRRRDSENGRWEVVEVNNADDLLDGELFAKMEGNPENYKVDEIPISQLKSEIRSWKLRDIPTMGITNAEIKTYNKPLYDKINEFNDERDTRQSEVVSNKNATLEKLWQNADSQLQESFRQWARRNVPLLNLFGGDEARAKDAFRESAGYKELLSKYHQKFEKLKTETDMAKIKYEIDMYYVALKELATMEYAIGEAMDENWNTWLSIIWRFTAFIEWSISNIILWFNQIINADGAGDVMMWLFNIWTWAGSIYLVYYAIRHPLKTTRFVCQKVSAAGWLIGRHLPANLIPEFRLKNYYKNNPKYLAYDYATGNISTEKANRVLKKMNQNNGNIFDYLKWQWILGQTNSDEVALFLTKNKEYLENPKIRKELFDKNTKRSERLNKKNATIIEIENSLYTRLKTISANVTALNNAAKTKFCNEIIKNAEIDDTAAFLEKMENYTKSDKFKDFDVSKMTNDEIRDLGRKIGKNIDNLADADEIAAYIETIKPTVNTTPPTPTKITNILDVADLDEVKKTVAYDVYTKRQNNILDLTKEFQPGGKYEKYADIETTYVDWSGNKKTIKQAYETITNTLELQNLDMILSNEMVTSNDVMVTDILEANRTAQLADFNTKIKTSIGTLKTQKSNYPTNPSDPNDKLPNEAARKSIDKQIDNLTSIKNLAANMSQDELEAFDKLYKILKKPWSNAMNNITTLWDKAKKNTALMDALAKSDVNELRRLSTTIHEITQDVLDTFESVNMNKSIGKILGASNADELLTSILKAFSRSARVVL